ncbi:MAG: histidine phosphatase family protein [Betaproteobacteria bacterium]|nr:histidine phosphatase family protein [Betaproteobacteria bacterium]
MTELILIRHGETLWNREGRIQGHLDSALTDEGIEQAIACGRRLAGESLSAFYCSDMGRAQHTARLIGESLRIAPASRADLRERAYGDGEGLTYAEIDQRFPEAFSKVRSVDEHYAVPGGETKRQFHDRVVTALTDLATAHAGGSVLVVTHGGVLGVVYRWLHDLPVASPHKVAIPNVAINRVAHNGGTWSIRLWGDVSHLGVETFEEV